MKQIELPPKQGLYDPQFEHDACGMGFVANIKGKKSHEIVTQALTVLKNLEHRGACGCEENTGDGAGILLQIPHKFFERVCKDSGVILPSPGNYGVGMIFLPSNAEERAECEKQFENIVKEEGQEVLGWRTVPICDDCIGETAKACEPSMKQIFIKRSSDISDDLMFERKLYIIRKRTENTIRYSGSEFGKSFYVASLSSKTIVYKGMLTAEQVDKVYLDLLDEDVETALALIHSRFSTNTFPSWERAHPNRYIIHNGEINTLRGNVNWMYARQSMLESELFGEDIKKIQPVINQDGSDSAMFDNCLELLALGGRSLPHAVMMMIPEPWSKHESMDDEKRAFYEYHSCIMEPWDGPAAMGFTDGAVVGAVLDRNGLRPSRYYITKDDLVVVASEVGVLEIAPERILEKGRLMPGRMFLVDTVKGRIITDEELKHEIASEHPYREWLNENLVSIEDLPEPDQIPAGEAETLIQRQQAFGYNYEDQKLVFLPMAKDGIDPVGSMGIDTPLAVLSDKPQILYHYFKQLFAQVTNPPIDALREEIVTGSEVMLGSEGNLLSPTPKSCHQIKLETPILTDKDLARLKQIDKPGFKSIVLPIVFDPATGGEGLTKAMDDLFAAADKAIEEGANILILSDRDIDERHAAIPALLAIAGLHHHLTREETRTRVSLILESGEPREVHHFCLLLGYGASAINPYLAFETIGNMLENQLITGIDYKHAIKNYVKAASKGVIKVLSKMGISTIQSYQGAQIFEAVGLNEDVIHKYFTWTPSRIGGIGMDVISKEAAMRHDRAYNPRQRDHESLDSEGFQQWRRKGEEHLFNPETIYKIQRAVRTNDYNMYKEFASLINNQTQRHFTLRGLMKFKNIRKPVPIDEVEPIEEIMKRFKTGAMSYGSISKEAHEALAIAMNRIGGKSNTGEGGEDPARFIPMANGDSRCSAIKQVASGRFGVTSHYLSNAKEIQIKMAQGAKPGEGGQLPGTKVYPWIAKTRYSTTGVGLISPPPHHDIYSIEDLAELIHDLKNANRDARISVKLVSEVGVGTIAAGVAKGRADVILVSGYDGGTGASPRTSTRHAGLPWELGLAETHQTLVLNNLRSRVIVETDGKLMTGRDIAIAALLGAEEYGFATLPLISLGCVMMRVCQLDTCPAGVATQNPELRKKFCGSPDYVVNLMHFIAQDLRETMAELGFRTINEMIGRTDVLDVNDAVDHWKTKGLDYSNLFYQPEVDDSIGRYCQMSQDHGLDKSFDVQVLLNVCKPALENSEKVRAVFPIRNTNRVVGTILGNEVTKRYGAKGLPEDTVQLTFKGSAGQSFGAFIPKGISLTIEGDSNDYIGKGLSGGKIIVYPPKESSFVPEKNIIIGNVAFYGATSGEAFVRGLAGERFCVRNSGAHTVVEGVGDHGCEYMTGGRVIVLGPTGRNFAAGMSGGIAYVLSEDEKFEKTCNREMVGLEQLTGSKEIEYVRSMIEKHVKYTNSERGKTILENWEQMIPKFIKVIPNDYKRVLLALERAEQMGLSGDEAAMAAFEENKRDVSRVGGK